MTSFLQQTLQGVENLSDPTETFAEALCTNRHHHELLEVDFVVSMLTTVDDIGHRHRQLEVILVAVQIGNMFPQGQALGQSSGTTAGHGNTQDPVGSNFALVGGSVNLHHQLVNYFLFARVHSDELWCNHGVHCLHRFEDTLTHVNLLVAIAQFHSLVLASGSSRWNRTSSKKPVVQQHVNLHGRVSTRVKNLTGFYSLDNWLLLCQGISKEGYRLGGLGSDQLLDQLVNELGDVVLSEVLDVSRVGGHCEERAEKK
mmetsp:Transcript_27731/g.44334  ORF Transcript_27731/g.44334 Transcript_27731/m.44334 type:complete len:257 (+) Transcript_27731:1130-1900(+)